MLDLVFNNSSGGGKGKEKFFRKIAKATLKELGFSGKNVGVSINLVGESKIAALNEEHRGKKKSTDVLSFPIEDSVSAGSAKNDIMLGDVFICLPVAKKRALEEGVGLDSELALLTVHGFLHLAGYDHESSKKERDKMFSLQSKILKKCASILFAE